MTAKEYGTHIPYQCTGLKSQLHTWFQFLANVRGQVITQAGALDTKAGDQVLAPDFARPSPSS